MSARSGDQERRDRKEEERPEVRDEERPDEEDEERPELEDVAGKPGGAGTDEKAEARRTRAGKITQPEETRPLPDKSTRGEPEERRSRTASEKK